MTYYCIHHKFILEFGYVLFCFRKSKKMHIMRNFIAKMFKLCIHKDFQHINEFLHFAGNRIINE